MRMRAVALRLFRQYEAMETILVVNAGSSSLKLQVFEIGSTRALTRLLKGQVDGVGVRPRLRAAKAGGSSVVDRTFPADEIPGLSAAIDVTAAWLRETQRVDLVAVGHRVVHGGPEFSQPVRVNETVFARLARYVSLAPSHQPTISRRSAP
jgi:acetate kinase